MGPEHRGYGYGLAAYACWGFVPLYFKLPREAARLAGFGLVWLALLIFAIDMLRTARRRAPALVPVEG